MISGCHRDEKVVLLIGSTSTWTVYITCNGFVVAFSVSLGIGVVSGNESDLSQDGKIVDQQYISIGLMLIQYHSSCPASWSAVRDFWIKSIIISLSLSCQNLSLVKILIQKIKVPGKVKIFFGIISLSLSCQNLFLVKILKIKVRWKSSFWKEEYRYVQTFFCQNASVLKNSEN